MKKLLTLLLTLLMIFTISGCNSSSQDEPIVDNPVIEEDTPLAGGFTEVEDGTLTDELKDIFNKALDGLMGATYEPVELVATQVVAGTNYKFLANGIKTTNPITKGTYYITIYKDLQGDVKLLDIETIEEKQEETASTDPSEYSYWVVFKNPDGNELQRTIEKYGTTPEYVGDTPVCWDSDYWYKFTGWDQELKPITTNTYITAEYEMGGPLKKETTVTPDPSPACLAAGTMITMADGTRKPIESLQEGDDIRIFNHNTGKLSHAKIMDYWQYEEPHYDLMALHFTNNINVNIVGAHSFFNKQENKYVVINHENINDYIGKQFYNADDARWETLLGVTYSNEPVDTFYIATEDQFDCIAEGMLTMEDGLYTLIADTFDYDTNMKINIFKKYLDILRYGLFTSKDIPVAKEEAFKLYKLQYIKIAIGKGLITKDQWDLMLKEILTYESDNINEEYIPSEQKHSAK